MEQHQVAQLGPRGRAGGCAGQAGAVCEHAGRQGDGGDAYSWGHGDPCRVTDTPLCISHVTLQWQPHLGFGGAVCHHNHNVAGRTKPGEQRGLGRRYSADAKPKYGILGYWLGLECMESVEPRAVAAKYWVCGFTRNQHAVLQLYPLGRGRTFFFVH